MFFIKANPEVLYGLSSVVRPLLESSSNKRSTRIVHSKCVSNEQNSREMKEES